MDLVAGYPADQMCHAGRGQLLLPWPNRVRDGSYTFDNRTYQLPLTEVPNRNAIHGLTRWANWTLLEHTASTARWGYTLHHQPGYPFSLSVQTTYRLHDDGLTVQVTATNDGDAAAPYGHGMHPYLTVGQQVDECTLTLPAETVLDVDERGLPAGSRPVTGSRYDFRDGAGIEDLVLDTPYTDLLREADGRAVATLHHAGSGRSVTLRVDRAYPWLQAFTGDTLGERAREAVALEPMTCPPDAFNSGVDLVTLAPGQSHTGSFTIS